jgi:hypothetical protein
MMADRRPRVFEDGDADDGLSFEERIAMMPDELAVEAMLDRAMDE